MWNTISALVLIIIGTWGAVRYKKYAKDVKYWHDAMHYPYDEKYMRLVFLVGGIIVSLVGILLLFGIIRMKI
jgi:hypothetical protein